MERHRRDRQKEHQDNCSRTISAETGGIGTQKSSWVKLKVFDKDLWIAFGELTFASTTWLAPACTMPRKMLGRGDQGSFKVGWLARAAHRLEAAQCPGSPEWGL